MDFAWALLANGIIRLTTHTSHLSHFQLLANSVNQTAGDDPITPTAVNGAGSDEDAAGAAIDAAAGSPDAHGNNSFAMRGASAMKQIRAPLEALFKRRGSTTPGGFARERDDGGSLSVTGSIGGALPGGLDARRGLLLASLQGGGSGVGLPAGKYMVEVDASGECWLGCWCWVAVGLMMTGLTGDVLQHSSRGAAVLVVHECFLD